jgi:hypothetical protein
MELLGDVGQVEAHFGVFRHSVNLAQDWCIVWDEHTKVSEIILGTPDGILCDVGQMDTHFGPFEDSVNMGTWCGMHIA